MSSSMTVSHANFSFRRVLSLNTEASQHTFVPSILELRGSTCLYFSSTDVTNVSCHTRSLTQCQGPELRSSCFYKSALLAELLLQPKSWLLSIVILTRMQVIRSRMHLSLTLRVCPLLFTLTTGLEWEQPLMEVSLSKAP